MNYTPELSICIVARNEEKRIIQCLESLVSQRSHVCFEILLVDNDSTDATESRVREFMARFLSIPTRSIRMNSNHLGIARGEAVRQSRGRYVAFTDADCIAPPGWVDGLLTAMAREKEADPSVLAVGSGNTPPPGSQDRFHQSLEVIFSSFLGNLGCVQATPFARTRSVNHLSTCNVIYDRGLLLSIGNFSSRFARVCEDLELSLRSRRMGLRMVYVPGLEVAHDHRAGILSWAEKMFRYGRGQIRVAALYPSHLLGVKGLPLLSFVGMTVLAGLLPMGFLATVVGYAIFFFVYGAFLIRRRGDGFRISSFRVAFLFFVTHAAYASGEAFESLVLPIRLLKRDRELVD